MEGPSPNLFVALRDLLLPYQADLLVVHDDGDHFYANCRNVDAKGKAQFFGAVKSSGRRHSFHFMPIYTFPELLAGIRARQPASAAGVPAERPRPQRRARHGFSAMAPSAPTVRTWAN